MINPTKITSFQLKRGKIQAKMAEPRKQILVSTLCKRLSLNPKDFSGDLEKCDVKSLCTNILKSSPNGSSLLNNDEGMKWIEFAENFPVDSAACIGAINGLNDELLLKSVLLGNGLKLSEADVIVYSVIHPCVVNMSKSDRQKFPNVLRWMDFFQNKEDFGDILENISIEKLIFRPPASKNVPLAEVNSSEKDAAKDTKSDVNLKKVTLKGRNTVDASEANKGSKKDSTQKKAKGDKATVEQKKPEAEAAPKDEVPVSLLNIQVGLIRKAWKHPSADSLLVEEIDVGESKVRQVVSGLAKFCSPDDLVNRRVALITNVKPGKLRDVVSEGLVLCASSEDHSVVEPLLPPEGAVVGERVSFSGHEGKPEDVLNPKKKQLDKITPHLYTDENGIATYKGIPFMTSGGPCTSSIKKGSIK
ncbi:aminoacyl tRNA synthase complex-interacting multifunctional protein 1-like [Chenopodium quinoa]|uniref:aminoacyl tRNA synthase complex-interacting multifunctional protein 1-like n=1 Tax=Chenopodium quinoa TaxID=63459 RepID=UPI000B793CEC|nr:aminoacyl tRNA synthase complex-interacting multifunctional protein 1-like [Chenopodium quinoa]